MAIGITPTTVRRVVTSEAELTANAVWIDGSNITTDRSTGKVSGDLAMTPYEADSDGNPVAFASSPVLLKTKDAAAACANIKTLPALFAAYYALAPEFHAWQLARAADLAAAKSRLDTAKAAQAETERTAQARVHQAKAEVDAAFTARNTAFGTRTSATDPAWLAADATWKTATDAHAAAVTAAASDAGVMAAKERTLAAEEDVKTAQAAFDDPANPPLAL